jgi:membrane protein DedA with SNARE-associated domain
MVSLSVCGIALILVEPLANVENLLNDILENHKYLPYLVLLIWTFLEGETIVIIAGAASTDDKPWLPLVILSAFCGSLCSDQLLFFLGRYRGKAWIAKRPAWQTRAERVFRVLERHQNWLILGFRFMYGLRNITPFSIGMSQVRTKKYVILNVIGAAIWAVAFSCGGYLFGLALQTWLAKYEKWVVIGAILAVAFVAWIWRLVRRHRNRERLVAAQLAQAGQATPTQPGDSVK